MKLIDTDTNREYAPIWIDGNNNLIVTTDLDTRAIEGVIVLHPCGMGSMYKKLLSTKEKTE